MGPGDQQDSSSEERSTSESECSVVKVIASPDVKRGRDQQPTSARQMLARKKEARELEEERIDAIIIEFGINPEEQGDFEARKELANALKASRQEEEQRIAFEREAGIIADDDTNENDGDRNDSRRSVDAVKNPMERQISSDNQLEAQRIAFEREAGLIDDDGSERGDNANSSRREMRGKRKTIEKTRDDSSDDDGVVTVSKRVKKVFGDSEEGSEVNQVSVTEKATTSSGKDETFPDFDQVMAQHNKGLFKTSVTTGVDQSSLPDLDSIASQYASGFVSTNSPLSYKFFKSKNKRVANERGDADDVKIVDASDDDESTSTSTSQQKRITPRKSQSFLDEAGEKADLSAKAAQSSSVSSTLINAGTFVKDCFSGFASTLASPSMKAVGKNESPVAGTSGYFSTFGIAGTSGKPEKKTQPETSKRAKGDSTLTLVKELLGDPKRMEKFHEWSAWFDAEAAQTPKRWTEEEDGVLTIESRPSVTFVPGTLIVDTQAAPPKLVLNRAAQGGVQPMRTCRMRQPLLGTAQAVAKVTEDPDSGDDFLPPLKRRVEFSTKKSASVIAIDDDEPEAADQTCPVCNKFFPAKKIEDHVDKCLSSQEKKGSGSGDEENRTVRTPPRRGRKRVGGDGDFLQR